MFQGIVIFGLIEQVLKLGVYFSVILLCIKAINALNIYIDKNNRL